MDYPPIPESTRLLRLDPPTGRVRMVLDTDTYNEIDDQFAVAYSLLAPERIQVEAIYAAPFHNNRSSGPGDGMEKSYEEILRLLDKLGRPAGDSFVFRGATDYVGAAVTPQRSAATDDLIARALASPEDDPLYVVAIGAITNIASAILLEPSIIRHIVVVWLGGNAPFWPHTWEFNLMQDVPAARVVLDCGVPFVLIPCNGVTTHLLTTRSEMEQYVRGRGPIGDYLADIYNDYMRDQPGKSKVIWDISTIAYLINPEWIPTTLIHSPVLTDQMTWSVDQRRHFIRAAYFINRDPIFGDLFARLAASAG